MKLEQELIERSKIQAPSQPLLLRLTDEKDKDTLAKLLKSGEVAHVVDDYGEQLKELFQINNPTLVYTPDFQKKFEDWKAGLPEAKSGFMTHGTWVFFPWNNTLVHVLPDEDFQRVRTARNRNLITEEEQKRFYNSVIGIGGLSVGNSVALALVLQGGARHLRLADFDSLALSNLNRIRAGVTELGLRKVEMTARQIYSLNPYATVELFPDGLTEENLGAFFDGPPGLNLVIDELDTLAVKLRIREEARKRKIAVLMGADNGDNAIIDIERHDLGTPPFFHGMLGNVSVAELSGLDKFGIGKTITKMLGAENITIRMQNSLLEMGKTIVSWPQLGGAALLNGIAVAFAARKVLTGEPLEENRALVSLDEKLDAAYHAPEEVEKRKNAAKKFTELFGL